MYDLFCILEYVNVKEQRLMRFHWLLDWFGKISEKINWIKIISLETWFFSEGISKACGNFVSVRKFWNMSGMVVGQWGLWERWFIVQNLWLKDNMYNWSFVSFEVSTPSTSGCFSETTGAYNDPGNNLE